MATEAEVDRFGVSAAIQLPSAPLPGGEGVVARLVHKLGGESITGKKGWQEQSSLKSLTKGSQSGSVKPLFGLLVSSQNNIGFLPQASTGSWVRSKAIITLEQPK